MVPWNFGAIAAGNFGQSYNNALNRYWESGERAKDRTYGKERQEAGFEHDEEYWNFLDEQRRYAEIAAQTMETIRFKHGMKMQTNQQGFLQKQAREGYNFEDYQREQQRDYLEYVRRHPTQWTIDQYGNFQHRMAGPQPAGVYNTPQQGYEKSGLARSHGTTQYVPARDVGLPPGEVPADQFGLMARALYSGDTTEPPKPTFKPWYAYAGLGDRVQAPGRALNEALGLGNSALAMYLNPLTAPSAIGGAILNLPWSIRRAFSDPAEGTAAGRAATDRARFREWDRYNTGAGRQSLYNERLRQLYGITPGNEPGYFNMWR